MCKPPISSHIFLILSFLFPLCLLAQVPKPVAKPAPTGAATAKSVAINDNFMYLVGMQIKDLKEVPLCYSTQNDVGKVKIAFETEDTINRLEDFVLMEDQIASPDCFVPEMKLIFKNYTYVISMYCTSVMMFKNSEPFTPSTTKLKSDLVFTESVYLFLFKLKKKYFKDLKIDPTVMAKIKIEKPLVMDDDKDAKELDAMLREEEELDEDKDLDIEDKGEFDKVEIFEKDPDDQSGGKP